MGPNDAIRSRLGCANCRKAKKKCDERTPCLRCVSKGLHCPGPRLFYQTAVLLGDEHEQHLAVAKDDVHNTTAQTKREINASERVANPDNVDLQLSSMAQPHFTWSNVAGSSMSRLIYESKTSGFLFSPWMSVESVCRSGGSFMFDMTLKAASMQSFALHEAPKDLAPAMTAMGARQYGEALSLVRKQLRYPKACTSNTFILCIMMLASYEFKNGAGPGFYSHMSGLTQLIKLRGPSLLETPESRGLLKAFRDRMIVSAMHRQAELPFNRLEHPWFFVLLENSDFDKLQVIALSLPGLILRSVILWRSLGTTKADAESLVLDAKLVLRRTQAWRLQLQTPTQTTAGEWTMMLRWHLLCEISCRHILNNWLTYLASEEPKNEDRRRLEAERAQTVDELRSSFGALCSRVSLLRRQGSRVYEDDVEIPFVALAASGYMLQPLLLAAMADDVDEKLRRWLLERACDLVGARKLMPNIELSSLARANYVAMVSGKPAPLIAWGGRYGG